jgi:hypothetical protein
MRGDCGWPVELGRWSRERAGVSCPGVCEMKVCAGVSSRRELPIAYSLSEPCVQLMYADWYIGKRMEFRITCLGFKS